MAELNLNFTKSTERREPTQNEIAQIEGLPFMIQAIVKALHVYASSQGSRGGEELESVCLGVCGAVELLIDPIADYMCEYAGRKAAPEEETA